MNKLNKLIIACDGESASGKSTAAKLISKKYKLLLVNSGLLYRYASKLLINNNPKIKIKKITKSVSLVGPSIQIKTLLVFDSSLFSNEVSILSRCIGLSNPKQSIGELVIS